MVTLSPRGPARRGGFTLVEILVALAVAAGVGAAILALVSTGARGSQAASEMQLGTVLAARIVDRLLSDGYPGVARLAGSEGDLDLAVLEEPADGTAPTTGTLLADGFIYSGRYAVEQKEPGLMALQVTLSWQPAGRSAQARPVSFRVVRFVADPAVAAAAREGVPR